MSVAPGAWPTGWIQRGEPAALGLRVARRIIGPLPTPLRYRIADVGGVGAHLLLRGRARAAARNYARVLGPQASPEEVAQLTRRAFRNYARTVLDFLLLERLAKDLLDADRVAGRAHLEQALALRRGALLCTAHFGNWDLGAAVTAGLGHPVTAVAGRFGRPAVDSLVRRARERLGTRVVGPGTAGARAVVAALRRGEVVAVVGDLDNGQAVVRVPFFGADAQLPAGPAQLALRTGAAVLTGAVWRSDRGDYRAAVDPPLAVERSGDRGEDVRRMTAAIAQRFERMIAASPEQWTAFRPLWPETGDGAVG